MENLEQKVIDLIDKSLETGGKLVDTHGQDAVDLALTVARIDAAGVIIQGAFFIAVGVLAALLTKHIIKKITAGEWEELVAIVTFPIGMGAVASLIGGAIDFINIWAWVGIFEPKLWLAHKAIQAVTS